MNLDLMHTSTQPSIRPIKVSSKSNMEESAKALEAQFAYMMLKAMDQSSSEGGLLGSKNQGLGHFKDVFFMSMAEKMVEHREIGFRQSLVNTYETPS